MSKSYDNYAGFKTELNKLRSNIKSGQLPRIIVVWGPSEYLLNKSCKIAKNSWLRQTNSPAVVHESSNLIKDGLDVVFEQAGLFTASSLHIVRRAEKLNLSKTNFLTFNFQAIISSFGLKLADDRTNFLKHYQAIGLKKSHVPRQSLVNFIYF